MDRRSFLKGPVAAAAAASAASLAVVQASEPSRRPRRVDAREKNAWCLRARVVNGATGADLRGIVWADEASAQLGVISVDQSVLEQFSDVRLLGLKGDVHALVQCRRVEIDLAAFLIRVWL